MYPPNVNSVRLSFAHDMWARANVAFRQRCIHSLTFIQNCKSDPNPKLTLTQTLIMLRELFMLQVDIDVGSSTTAASVVGLVAGAVKSLVIDMAIVLQARAAVVVQGCPSCRVLPLPPLARGVMSSVTPADCSVIPHMSGPVVVDYNVSSNL